MRTNETPRLRAFRRSLLIFSISLVAAGARAEVPANLLRNGDFQDDWITLIPETKNHHWCYSSEFTNRRDYNPDGWWCRGSWEWVDADAPPGPRKLVLRAPAADVSQRVNWVMVHDDRRRDGFPDAGGFPAMQPQRSSKPLAMVRNLTLRLLVSGKNVPEGAGVAELGLCPPGVISTSDPLGTDVAATASRMIELPSGTFAKRWLEVTLEAADWLEAARRGGKAGDRTTGPALPGSARVSVRYKGATGSLTLDLAELIAAEADVPNLLPTGGFEELDRDGYPWGWSRPRKYEYFPPALYYIFNTWHNSGSANRGPVAADTLVLHEGSRSLQMIVASGDETAVTSNPIELNQREPRLLEVRAWAKTDRLATLQIDAIDERGRRLDGFNFIHKAPVSIGTNDWRVIRQVFRPREPVRSVRLLLCARGVNGYTLDDTGTQPQNNVTGTIWWDDIKLFEPESDASELAARGVLPAMQPTAHSGPHFDHLDFGERLLGTNAVGADIVNPGPAQTYIVRLELTSPSGPTEVFESGPIETPQGGSAPFLLVYKLNEPSPAAYTEYRGKLSLVARDGRLIAATTILFGTWTTPIDLELGALYLRPEQHQLVRANLGLSYRTIARASKVQVEVLRRGTGEVLKGWEFRDVARFIKAQRARIPVGLRDDLLNLLLVDLDLSFLPLQPFDNPERNWLIRMKVVDHTERVIHTVDSPPFCRLGHAAPQPPITSVAIRDEILHINNRPWIPWGAIYGHFPVYAGAAGSGPLAFRDLQNLPGWNLYEGLTSDTYSRRLNDLNCMRYVAGTPFDRAALEKRWSEDNLYASTAFVTPQPVFSLAELEKQAGGRAKLDSTLAFMKEAPMAASVAPGIEEVFGLFRAAGPDKIEGLGQVVELLRSRSGKPVMVGHGGFWNRFEFEKVPYFDIYDPETEPLYPADVHTDLAPLVKGRNKLIWLRPQMYEDVPYERWRFHAYVELMRGCRGWQIAHGPGDASLFRGLHGELEHLKPAMASRDVGPEIRVEPWIEHWSRLTGRKLTLIAATTRGIPFGAWNAYVEREPTEAGRVTRKTGGSDERPDGSLSAHGIQSLPNARAWPKGSTLQQWVWLHPNDPPRNIGVLAKGDGRWTHISAWGDTSALALRESPALAFWFLKTFYRHAEGFLGWDQALVPKTLDLVPGRVAGNRLPEAGRWVRLEIGLDKIGAVDKLLDGVGFVHQGGTVYWGTTSFAGPDGRSTVIWGDSIALAPEQLASVRFQIPGLRKGTRIRALFEDRELTADEQSFVDDFRGQDLYQRYGGEHTGYGSAPVALHAYEMDID